MTSTNDGVAARAHDKAPTERANRVADTPATLSAPSTGNGSQLTERAPSYALQLIRSIKDSLPPSQARVAQVILARPFEVLEWSAEQLGEAAQTSAASVVRTCQSLAFEGFDELRLTLARDLGWHVPNSSVVTSDASEVMHELFSAASEALPQMLRTVDATVLQQVVDALVMAKTVLVVASGGDSVTLASELAFGLTMVGRLASSSPDQMVQHVAARNLDPGDVCVVVSKSGSSRPTIEEAVAAHEAGALVVAFGSHVRSHLEEVVDLSVPLDRIGYFLDSTAAINHVGLSLAIRALVLAVRARLGERADRALRTNLDLISTYDYRARRR